MFSASDRSGEIEPIGPHGGVRPPTNVSKIPSVVEQSGSSSCRLNGPHRPADTHPDMSERESPALFSVKLENSANISGPQSDIQETVGDVRSLDSVARLVDRAKDGDKDAFGQIFRLHRDAILRFARFRLGVEADDVVSEVFTRAWITLHRYEYTGLPFVAWLYGIARHVVADELVRRSRTLPQDDLPETFSDGRRTIGSTSSPRSSNSPPSSGRSSR